MKTLILLLGILIAIPIFAQNSNAVRISNTVYQEGTLDGIQINLAVSKIIEDKRVSYDVRFYGGGDTYTYSSGVIKIDSFLVYEYNYIYTVYINYINTTFYYAAMEDREGNEYAVPYSYNKRGHDIFNISKE